jgi:hypothetical protein
MGRPTESYNEDVLKDGRKYPCQRIREECQPGCGCQCIHLTFIKRSQDESQGTEIGGEIDVEDVSPHKAVVPYCDSMYFYLCNKWLY